MMIPSNYSINVTKDGKHHCKIELGSIPEKEAWAKFDEISDMIWNSMGDEYTITLQEVTCYSKDIAERSNDV